MPHEAIKSFTTTTTSRYQFVFDAQYSDIGSVKIFFNVDSFFPLQIYNGGDFCTSLREHLY